eukprot:5462412-Amphidinium_carterae.1
MADVSAILRVENDTMMAFHQVQYTQKTFLDICASGTHDLQAPFALAHNMTLSAIHDAFASCTLVHCP